MSFEDIIVQVKSRPVLWQPDHVNHRNRAAMREVYQDIARELETDEWTIRKRWKHLKDQYRKELKKVLSTEKPSNWQHYNDLTFMTDFVLLGRQTKKSNTDTHDDSETDVESNNEEQPSPKRLKRTPEAPYIPITTEKSKRDSKNITMILHRLTTMKQFIQEQNKPDEMRNDPDYMHLVSLLPMVKKLTDIQKLHLRSKINDWLLDKLTQNEYSVAIDSKEYVRSQIIDNS